MTCFGINLRLLYAGIIYKNLSTCATCFAIVLICISISSPQCFAQIGAFNAGDITSLQNGWVELKKQDSISNFTARIVESSKETIEKSRQLSIANSEDKMFVSSTAKGVIAETVFVKSPLYGFALATTVGSTAGWKLIEMYKSNENAKIDELIFNQMTCRCIYPLSGFIESSLSDCLKSNKLTITSIAKRSDSDWFLGFQYKFLIAERNLTIDFREQ